MRLDKETYTLEEFIAMARKHPDLVPVAVEKMRYGFTVEGIICEYAQVWFNGALVESACCESENYAGMRQVIEALGIAAMPNTNYLKAAKARCRHGVVCARRALVRPALMPKDKEMA